MKIESITFKIIVCAFILLVGAGQMKGQTCSASFVYGQGTNGAVSFTSTSIPANTATAIYNWNFGPSTYSNTGTAGIFPTYTYSTNGSYTVILTVSNVTPACTSSFVAVITVTNVSSGCGLVANFTTSNAGNGNVNFINTSTGTVSGTTYTWNFGSGFTTTAVNTNMWYGANGNYVATLTANNNGSVSCISTKTLNIPVTNICNLNPNISFTTGGNGNCSILGNSGLNSGPTTFTLNYGNGAVQTNSALSNANYGAVITYTSNGIYTITLIVANTAASSTCNAVYTQTIAITNVNLCTLNPNFLILGSSNVKTFSNVSTGTVSGTTYTWNFGDGNSSNSISPSNTYSTNGIFTVTLNANNNGSIACVGTKTSVVNTLSVCLLNPNFSTIQTSTPGVVNFINTSTGTTSASTFTYNFGNGISHYSANDSTYFNSNGVYIVTLTANSGGTLNCTSTKTIALNVTNSCPSSASITYTNNNGLVNVSAILSSTASGWNYGWYSFTNYGIYNFGNSAPTITLNLSNGANFLNVSMSNTTFLTPCYVFTNISIPVTGSSNCSLTAAFTDTLGSNGNVAFTDNSVGSNQYTMYHWSFGDGYTNSNYSNLQNPNHTYTSSGTFTVTQVVVYPFNNSCIDSISSVINVSLTPCPSYTANFTHTLSSNGLVNFTDASVGTNSNTNYFWDFGDGVNSSVMSPSHTYSNAGTHYVIHRVNNFGCPNDSVIYAINITGIPCVANANFNLVPSGTAQLWYAVPVYPYNLTNATWTWGDNSSSNNLYAFHQYSASAMYSICLTASASCGATASACNSYSVYRGMEQQGFIYIQVVSPQSIMETGIAKINVLENHVSIYPNPASTKITIQLMDLEKSSMNIQVYDMIGNSILEEKIENHNSSFEKEISVENFSNGIYFLRIQSGNDIITRKIMVQKY